MAGYIMWQMSLPPKNPFLARCLNKDLFGMSTFITVQIVKCCHMN